MSRPSLPAPFSGFADAIGRTAAVAAFAWLSALSSGSVLADADEDVPEQAIELELSPRICTLAAGVENCDTVVTAQWRAPRDESLCLLIVGHPQVRRCWESHKEGVYSVRLLFDQDLLVELRDLQLQKVLASKAIAVIKEALRLRRKRRQPWDILSSVPPGITAPRHA